jgi:glycosyltransferase involved in cell wall biosynthesis
MSKYLVILCTLFCSIYPKLDPNELIAGKTYRISLEGTAIPISASIIVPCHPAHAKHLYNLLRMLEGQTVLPDEVIISLSEYAKVPEDIIIRLAESYWAFPVTIILSGEQLFAGQNRNVAAEYAQGEIFIFQDADDEPHKRRVEAIKLLFHTYELDHLMHKFVRVAKATDKMSHYRPEIQEIMYLRPMDYANAVPGKHLTNGNIAISKELFKMHPWPNQKVGEDEKYNRMLYERDVRRLIIMTPLFLYRYYFSTIHSPDVNALASDMQADLEQNIGKEHKTKIIAPHDPTYSYPRNSASFTPS